MTPESRRSGAPRVVADLMTYPVVTISPDASVQELARVLARAGVSGLPVVEADDTVLGTVSVADILWLSDRLVPLLTGGGRPATFDRRPLDLGTVREIMSPDVFGLEPDASMEELCEFFSRTGLHRAPVLEEGKLVGIVSISDLLPLIAGSRPEGDEAGP